MIDLEFLQMIAEEAARQGNLDSVMDGFWAVFSWTGGDR